MASVAIATLIGVVLAHGRLENSALEGTYVIVNRASGRRIISRPSGFSASSGGPDKVIHQEHRWQFIPQGNDTYLIQNFANGMRIFAQTGKDNSDGFLTIDQGPIYQDQMWRLLLQNDGSFVLVNARSARVITAQVGLDGAAGFVAIQTSIDLVVSEDQAWWLVDPDHGEPMALAALQKCQAQLAEEGLKSRCHPDVKEEAAAAPAKLSAEAVMRNGSEAESSEPMAPPQSEQAAAIASLRDLAVENSYLCWACAAVFLLLVIFFWKRRLQTRKVLGAEISHAVFDSQVEGVAARIVKIICPGVEHGGIEIDLINDGCDVTIRRQASLGVEAQVWKKRFRFKPSEGQGPFEFREDIMHLEHGYLQLFFQARSFQGRTVRFPQHYNLASSDGDHRWEVASTSAGSFACPSSPSESLRGGSTAVTDSDNAELGDLTPVPRKRSVSVGGA